MGTDRKGPLAALIVVALIAVILLVTAVRSQADDRWHAAHHPVAPPSSGVVGQGR